ncbi:MAG: hypothetical protein R3359_01075 [Marinirhabdus sp.]|nr:hypothetical protein [Marinirhabdus sp.]
MKQFLFVSLLSFAAAVGCKDSKPDSERPNEKVVKEAKASQNYSLIQGTWRNVADTLSTLVFKDSTTTNYYEGLDTGKTVVYSIGNSCQNNLRVTTTEEDKYISTGGTTGECYYIEQLDDDNLVMRFMGADILLRFIRVQ